MRLLFAVHFLVALVVPLVARATEKPLGPAEVNFVGWSRDEQEAAFVQSLPDTGHKPGFRIVHLVDIKSRKTLAYYRLPGPHRAVAAPKKWLEARPYSEWQALSRENNFAQYPYTFADSTVRLRPVLRAPLVVRAKQARLLFASEADKALNFEVVARLMDGSEASLGVFLQPCAQNQTLHGALAMYRSTSGKSILVMVDIWDERERLVDRDLRLVALGPAPLGHIQIGLRRANNEIAREVRDAFFNLHPRAQKEWDHHIGPLF